MPLKIWVHVHSLGALGCEYMLNNLIIYVTFTYILISSLTYDNFLMKVCNPQLNNH